MNKSAHGHRWIKIAFDKTGNSMLFSYIWRCRRCKAEGFSRNKPEAHCSVYLFAKKGDPYTPAQIPECDFGVMMRLMNE